MREDPIFFYRGKSKVANITRGKNLLTVKIMNQNIPKNKNENEKYGVGLSTSLRKIAH
jgi:hypothetical protein